MSFRAGLGLGCLAAMLVAVPAAIRLASQGGPVVLSWLLLAGGSALVFGPALALARASRPPPLTLIAAMAGASAISIPLLVFARLLHRNTHHRPLGAATFAIGALLLVAFASFAAWRAFVWLRSSADRGRTLVVSSIATTALVAGALLALGGTSREWSSSITDGALALALLAGGVAVRLDESWNKRLSRLAVPVWAVLVVAAVLLSRASPGTLVGQAAPVLGPLNGW